VTCLAEVTTDHGGKYGIPNLDTITGCAEHITKELGYGGKGHGLSVPPLSSISLQTVVKDLSHNCLKYCTQT